MANMAMRDQADRIVHVKRVDLIATLEANKAKHVADYNEAMAGYQTALMQKLDTAFEDAKVKLAKRHEETKAKVAQFTPDDISKQNDTFMLVESLHVTMRVPRSYEKQYDAAIDIAKWDVRETLELTHAEFTCFVRDQWDWTNDFAAVSAIYKAPPLR